MDEFCLCEEGFEFFVIKVAHGMMNLNNFKNCNWGLKWGNSRIVFLGKMGNRGLPNFYYIIDIKF